MFPNLDYQRRIDAVRRLMAERGVDVMLLSVGADLPYFTGYEAMPLERLTMLVVPRDGSPTLVVPRLEAPRVDDRGGVFAVRPWEETDDPVALTAGLAGSAKTVAIGDQTWSVFALGLQRAMPGVAFTSATTLTAPLRTIKDDEEIDLLRAAAQAVDRVIDRLDEVAFAGRKEREVAGDIAALTVEEGHEVSLFTIVAAGPNGASPHHESADRIIDDGDVIVLDFGGRHHGYCSDTTRTLAVGEMETRARGAFAVLEDAQRVGREAVRPGVTAQEVDRATRRVIDDAGFGEYFVHRTGHGIGLEAHEHPYIVEGNEQELEVGMAFSIEPGIYVPGSFGMRIEDIVVCAPDGVDELNRSFRGLHPVA